MSYKTRLGTWGRSSAIRLPKSVLVEAGLYNVKDVEFQIYVEGRNIVLAPTAKLSPFAQLFEGFSGDAPEPSELIKSPPVGREVF